MDGGDRVHIKIISGLPATAACPTLEPGAELTVDGATAAALILAGWAIRLPPRTREHPV